MTAFITPEDPCDHDVVPYGDGRSGRCTKCGDDSFPLVDEHYPFDLSEEVVEARASQLYGAYCAAFMQQKTLRPKHPGQMPLAPWQHQREEIRECWRAVARIAARLT